MVSPEIFSSEPSPERLPPHGLLVLLTGPTGVGKDTTLDNLITPYHRIVTYATRKQGDFEIEGKDYYFITKEKFMAMDKNHKFFEHDINDSGGYGTTWVELQNKLWPGLSIWRLNPQGVFRLLEDESKRKMLEPFVVIGLWADLNLISERLIRRGREKGYVVVDRTNQAFKETEALKKKFPVAGNEKLFFHNSHSWTTTPLTDPEIRIGLRMIENREGLRNPRGLPRTIKLVEQTVNKLNHLWSLGP